MTQNTSKRPPELEERQPVNTESNTWVEWRDTHEKASLLSEPPSTIFHDWYDSREDTNEPQYEDRHYAEAQMCAGLRDQQFGPVIEAIMNLQRYALATERPTLAAGYARYIEKLVSDRSARLSEAAAEEASAIIDQVDEDIVETLRILNQELSGFETVWPIYWFWCVDEVRAGTFAHDK
ncbi:hypothetical protein SVXHr_2746 [Halorhabdus sp. SVX81]|nr:hypothetical protein SVXHr_2746 [Halorhabdus sp. SVX81]